MGFDTFIWDFDGTLFDTYPHMITAAQLALKDEGICESREEIFRLLKVTAGHALKHYRAKYGELPELDKRFNEYESCFDPADISPMPFAREVCLNMVTTGGRNLLLTHRERRSTEALLKHHHMRELFTDCVCKEDGFKRKPHPEAFQHLVTKHELNPARTLAIGDRDIDVFASQGAGLRACYLLYDRVTAAPVSTDHCICTLAELLPLIG